MTKILAMLKAIVGGVAAAAAAYSSAAATNNGHLSQAAWIAVLVAFVVATGGVWGTSNNLGKAAVVVPAVYLPVVNLPAPPVDAAPPLAAPDGPTVPVVEPPAALPVAPPTA